jgi:dTDP-4-dehydrorhamnose reductase
LCPRIRGSYYFNLGGLLQEGDGKIVAGGSLGTSAEGTMRLLVTGASGNLGGYLLRELAGTQARVTAWSGTGTGALFGFPLRPVDLAARDAVAAAFREARPNAVVHTAAVSSLAECRRDPQRARAVNAGGSALLAELAADAGARLVLVSTDLVFDGEKGDYREEDLAAPVSVYGGTKQAAEQAVLAAPHAAVARVSLLFGPTVAGRPAFFDEQVRKLRGGEALDCFADEWRTPLSFAAAARALLALARSDVAGLLHIGGPERLSRLDMAARLAAYLGADARLLVATSRLSAGGEPRPRDVSLNSSRWRRLFPEVLWPGFEEALRLA